MCSVKLLAFEYAYLAVIIETKIRCEHAVFCCNWHIVFTQIPLFVEKQRA